MNENNEKLEGVPSNPKKVARQRRRRHFTESYKRNIVAKIVAGKMDIENVNDPSGGKITKYLVERWKAEYRGQRFLAEAASQNTTMHESAMKKPTTQPYIPSEPAQYEDVYQEMIRLRNENERLKAFIAMDLNLNRAANAPKTSYSGRY